MDFVSSISSSSGSFDGAMFARYMLEPNPEGCTPPRITRFSFEDEDVRDNITSSFSGQFSSYYGLPYDSSPPPEENNQDAASEHSSRGPSTPSAPDHLPLTLDPSSPLSMSIKPLDDPFTQDSASFFLDPHSLPPGQSLLNDTPSYLGLASARSQDIPSPSRPPRIHSQTIFMSPPVSVPARQTISPVEDYPQVPDPSRGATVEQLALKIPMSRSRSGSLSTLIHALEDASPGWYQSLMDTALPHSVSQSPLATLREASRYPKHSSGLQGLPSSMLTDLAELEILAFTVARLPIPRPRTMALEVVATAFFAPSSSAPPLPRQLASLQPCSLTSLEEEDEERERQPTVRYAATIHSREEDRSSDVSSSSPRSAQDDYSCYSASADQPAFTNLTHHPKLTKTLGMRSSLPATTRSLAPAPKTPPWRAGRHSAIPRMSAQPISRGRPPPLLQDDMKIPKEAPRPQTPHKTPKPRNLQSLFRRRPSAPPMPMQPPDLGASPVQNKVKRAAHLSEPVMRLPLHRTSDSPLGKPYGAASEAPYLLPPQSPLGSFLPM
ncbi:hypothetical protein L226DRAFT_244683 [Lentinus tigrinus ALCF2SS1-7]|uniref:Uncharacterized protein n=1 Tax=Lentinus tigrinus ALCF2SS1-6 TaxID=1328759 RepID=A0A5C2SQG9_9APHY|nr:hypothetical protein L227DRAFT_209286 [Lentinus tigrinus ALCF2SS1-6]RPD79233.1 hypothetical protein L226DRAFT_244683 [Lentinus tigrinus ALCF2SS1-7]